MTLADVLSPTFASPPNGSLTSATSTARLRTVNYSAADVGGGIYRQRLLADGKEVAGGPVDANDGRCVRYPVGNGFSSPVPCRTNASGSLTYDTAGLSDGAHDLELQVFDATNENKVVNAWTVQVDNTPPVVGEVQVTGTPRDGDVLRCGAAVSGQSPRLAYQWLRTSVDGSDAKEISGAMEVAYTVASDDVGKKLLCRVTATDGGGSNVRTSVFTTGPFAGAVVVVARGNATAGGGSGAAANSPAQTVCSAQTVTLSRTPRVLMRSYRRSGMRMSGRLTQAGGGARIGGAALDVVQTVRRAGAVQRKKIASVTTRADGSFNAKVPAGPTRTLQLVAPGCGTVGPAVAQRVRGSVLAKTTTRRVRNKQVARFRGRVLGGYVGRGLPLELQVQIGASWKDVKAVTTNSRGEYRVGYRFQRTFVRYTYRFRIVSRAGSAWPFMPARSHAVAVRVN